MLKKAGLWRGLSFLFTIFLAISITAGAIMEQFKIAVDSALGTKSEEMVTEKPDMVPVLDASGNPVLDEFGNPVMQESGLWEAFVPPEDILNTDKTINTENMMKKFIDFGRRQGSDSAVLLKNSNNVLPLSSGSKVTLFGIRSHMFVQGASFGMPISGPVITLEDALGGTKTDFRNPYNLPTPSTTPNANYTPFTEFNFTDLNNAGAGFSLNTTMIDVYKAVNNARTSTSQNGQRNKLTRVGPRQVNTTNFHPSEASIAEIEAQNAGFRSSFSNFNDAAIVVVGRPSGESNDYGKGGIAAGLGATEPLALTTDEREAIKLATDNFSKVIVLVNTTSTMEIEELKNDPKIQSILWVGHPGNYGTLGVADVLCGKVSPSGGLSDLYAAKNLSHPALSNYGVYQYSNATEVVRGNSSRNYYIQTEGLYTGYRYFESRYNDIVLKQNNADSTVGAIASTGNWRYNQEVSYGFGYGLSYSTFTQEFVGTPVIERKPHEIYMTFTVKVTNTGTRKGRSNIQIYGQAPYIKGGVEKPAIQLLEYDKVKELNPGASETITLTVDLQNLASYNNTFKNSDGSYGTYILDNGRYYFALGNGAHDALNNVLTKQGKTIADGMDYNGIGTAAKVFEWNYTYSGTGTVDYTTFAISKSNVRIQNQIPYADWNYLADADQKVVYLSRNDWSGTYPTVTHNSMKASKEMLDYINCQYYVVKTEDDTSDIIFDDTSVDISFADMRFTAFDDPRWDDLMNKISLYDAMGSLAMGGPRFRALPTVGYSGGTFTENSGNGVALKLSAARVAGAPWQVKADDPFRQYDLEVFASGPNVASSFDPALQKELGDIVGLQACLVSLPILWGPGLNTHRTPYNGRNGDYYSEDPVLCGITAMEFAIGALRYGLIAAPKHFAFNDQEQSRGNIAPYMTEQRAREIELRAFQIAVESPKYNRPENFPSDYPNVYEGKRIGMLGLMYSFSKIGPVECTASYGLSTGILKGEWGFKGYAVTDISDDFDIFTLVAQSGTTCYDVRSGYLDSGFGTGTSGGFWSIMNVTGNPSFAERVRPSPELYRSADGKKGDRVMQLAFKEAAKNNLWVFAQSNLMNSYNSSSHLEDRMTWWRATYIGLISGFGVFTVAAAALYIFSVFKLGKEVN